MGLVRYELEDGTEVYFEVAEGSLVSTRSGELGIVDAGRLGDRLRDIASAAAEVSEGLRDRLGPDEVELTFGVKVSGKINSWFVAQAGGEATMQVKLTWRGEPETPATSEPSPGD